MSAASQAGYFERHIVLVRAEARCRRPNTAVVDTERSMLILQIISGVFIGAVALRVLATLGEIVDGTTSIVTRGCYLRKPQDPDRRSDWFI